MSYFLSSYKVPWIYALKLHTLYMLWCIPIDTSNFFHWHCWSMFEWNVWTQIYGDHICFGTLSNLMHGMLKNRMIGLLPNHISHPWTLAILTGSIVSAFMQKCTCHLAFAMQHLRACRQPSFQGKISPYLKPWWLGIESMLLYWYSSIL